MGNSRIAQSYVVGLISPLSNSPNILSFLSTSEHGHDHRKCGKDGKASAMAVSMQRRNLWLQKKITVLKKKIFEPERSPACPKLPNVLPWP